MASQVITANVLTGTGAPGSGGTTVSGFDATGANYVVVFVAQGGTPNAGRTCTVNGVSASSLFTPPSSGGGFSGYSAFGLASPTSGSVVVALGGGVGHACAVIVVPMSGVDLVTPFGTWVLPGNVNSATPSTGSITGVDSTGFFLNFASIFNAIAVTAPGTGATSFANVADAGNNIRAYATTIAGAASATWQPTLASAAQVNVGGVYVNAGATGYTMTCDSGSYSLNGQDVALVRSSTYTLTAETGFYSLIGSSALVDVSMVAESGNYALTGFDAILRKTSVLVADFGSYVLNGQAVNLIYSGAASGSSVEGCGVVGEYKVLGLFNVQGPGVQGIPCPH